MTIDQHTAAGASTVGADIVRQRDGGGFVAVASNGDLDRDGERIQPHCFDPLPDTVPIHLDHTMRAASVVGRGRPYYDGDRLMLDGKFASTPDAQQIRQKVADGAIDSVSIVFRGLRWEDVDGVRTCIKGELLAADLVSVPSNSGARVLSVRSAPHPMLTVARAVSHDALVTLARVEVKEATRALDETSSHAPNVAYVRRFLRSL